MISKINICNAATFGNDIQVMDDLKKFNYLFGTNGSGKTTISTILADQSQFSSSNVSWKSGLALETRVYNRDFVERNFNPQSKLKGVFTLGELESDTLNKIETMKNDINGNESRSNVTLQNTLRRILENYFKLLGGISLDNLYKEFEGEDKIICKSLCSWINDGSHSAFDDYYYTPLDNEGIDKYLVVFKRIFENCNQIAHYNMMMGKNFEQDGIEEAS